MCVPVPLPAASGGAGARILGIGSSPWSLPHLRTETPSRLGSGISCSAAACNPIGHINLGDAAHRIAIARSGKISDVVQNAPEMPEFITRVCKYGSRNWIADTGHMSRRFSMNLAIIKPKPQFLVWVFMRPFLARFCLRARPACRLTGIVGVVAPATREERSTRGADAREKDMESSETGSTAATEIGAPEGPQAQAAPAAAQRQDVAAPENGGPKLSFQPRLRKACDLCHEGRLRCVMTKNGKCEQCIVRGFNCILRVEKKRGRPRLDEATIAERVARSAADRAHQSYLYNSSGALGNVPAYPCSAMVPSNSGHLTTMPPGYQGSAMAMPGQPNLPLLPPQLYGDPYCFQPGVYGAVSFQRGAFPAGFQPAYMHLPSSAAGLAQNPQDRKSVV